MEMVLTGDRISAQDAKQAGGVSDVVSWGRLRLHLVSPWLPGIGALKFWH